MNTHLERIGSLKKLSNSESNSQRRCITISKSISLAIRCGEGFGGGKSFHITSGWQTESSTLTEILCDFNELFTQSADEPI